MCDFDTVGAIKTLPEVRERIEALKKEKATMGKDDPRRATLDAMLEALNKKKGELEDP